MQLVIYNRLLSEAERTPVGSLLQHKAYNDSYINPLQGAVVSSMTFCLQNLFAGFV